MSINVDGVRIKSKSKNKAITLLLILCQFVLSVFVYISLAANIIWPEKGMGAAGVSQMISYEGYLTDTSGSPLGGTGEPYCFRFSIYDNGSLGQGTKLWPAGTPTNTKATTTAGVFNALIGQADALTYNFYDSDSVYLNVDVNTATSTCAGSWETLGPRQQIAASGYAFSSQNVYGTILRTDVSNGRAQVGTGAGGASPKYLGLDVKNTTDYVGLSCTTSGTVWYNSAISKALVCENGTIQAMSNAGTSTIASLTTNSGAAGYATTGTIVFSNSNGVTFGINGNTITASVAAAGGNTVYSYEPWPIQNTGTTVLSANTASSGSASFIPFDVYQNVAARQINMIVSMNMTTGGASSFNQSRTMSWGIYTRGTGANSTTMGVWTSNSLSYAMSYNNSSMTISQATTTNNTGYGYSTTASAGLNLSSQYTGLKLVQLLVLTTMTPGHYWLGIMDRASSSSFNSGILYSYYGNNITLSSLAPMGSLSTAYTTGTNIPLDIGGNWNLAQGVFSSAGQTNLPTSLALSALTQNLTVIPYMKFASTS